MGVKKIKMFSLLMQSGIISRFDKEPSFDRLFPNQDQHSGKGLGNLIALPLQGTSLKSGNSCFISPETFEPINDQWKYLAEIKRLSKSKIDSQRKCSKNGIDTIINCVR